VHAGAFSAFLFGMAEAEVFKYADAKVTLRKRGDGNLIASWREDGRMMKSSRADSEKTREWARRKVRELGARTGMKWVSPAQGDRLLWLERIAGGGPESARVLADLEEAMATLAGRGTLREAARWFVDSTPAGAERVTLADAVGRFVAFYKAHHPRDTVCGPKSELEGLAKAEGGRLLREVDADLLGRHVRRGKPVVRTVRNRISYWVLFFNWCKGNALWPEGRKTPAAGVKKPRKVMKSPEIFTPEHGALLLRTVAEKCPQHLAYAVLAGWLGLRPSECVRMEWADLDFEQGLVHVRAEVARKVARERWLPMTPQVAALLKGCQQARRNRAGRRERVCRLRAQVEVSAVARAAGMVWSIDVLRHSRITYRLQETRDIGLVAEESGNSPGEIRASYKRPIPPGEAEKWRAVLGALAGTILRGQWSE
jgi:integrase